jgi:hypothetical protein
VKGPLHFRNELLRSSTQNQGARLGGRASLKEVEALASDLTLLKVLASTEVLGSDVGTCGLKAGSDGLEDTLHVIVCHTSSTEDVSVGEEPV